MNNRTRFQFGSCATIFLALNVATISASSAQESYGDVFWQYRATAGVDYSSGHYGAATTTDVVFTYVSLRADKGPWSLKAVVPWLSVSGPAVLLDGRGSGSIGTTPDRSVSGAGDINLSATYALERFYDRELFIDFTARLKIPTASFAKGLGTGQADGAFQIDVAKAFGNFMPFLTLGYKLNGSPVGYHLRHVLYGTVGVQYSFSESVTAGALFDYRQAALKTAEDPREGTAYVNIKLSPKWALNAYGVAGFSRNSPSGGGGATVTYRW